MGRHSHVVAGFLWGKEPVFPWENSPVGTCGWLLVGKVKQFSHGDRWLASRGECEAVFPWGKPPSWDKWLVFLGENEAVFPWENSLVGTRKCSTTIKRACFCVCDR